MPIVVAFARDETFHAIVAVGGGSSIDTAKAVNLYTSYPPADFLDYVNPPIGKGLAVPGPVKPLFAIPTTAGTGSETTGVAIFDLTRLHVKTGISSRLLKPTLGFLDPDHTRTLPPAVAASAGLDILCHAVESYTAIPFTSRPRSLRPSSRPPCFGSRRPPVPRGISKRPRHSVRTCPDAARTMRAVCWRSGSCGSCSGLECPTD